MTCWQHWLGLQLLATVAVVSSSSNNNNYEALAGHQVWLLESEGAEGVVDQLQVRGLVDVLARSEQSRTVRVAPESASLAHAELQEAGVPYRVQVEDLAPFIQEEQEKEEKARKLHMAESCTAYSCPSPLTYSYMSFKEIEWYLMEVNKNPMVSVKSIGKSIQGRDIWMVHIKSGCKEDESVIFPKRCPISSKRSTKPKSVWLEGGIHAREWISPAVALQLIDKIAHDCCVTLGLDVYVVPMANPDGYVYTWNKNRLWRKNRRKNSGSDCYGVDLNRNWNEHFGVGASDDPCSDVYMGPKVFSEPETQALSDEMQRVAKGDLKLVIAIHSYGQTLLYPWGWTTKPAPDYDAMVRLGKVFAKNAKRSYGTVYTVSNSAVGVYFAAGATDDWAKGVLKTKYAYTLELRDEGSQGFELSPNQILPTGTEVWAGLKAVFRKIASEK